MGLYMLCRGDSPAPLSLSFTLLFCCGRHWMWLCAFTGEEVSNSLHPYMFFEIGEFAVWICVQQAIYPLFEEFSRSGYINLHLISSRLGLNPITQGSLQSQLL
jgi:hypothetical protein